MMILPPRAAMRQHSDGGRLKLPHTHISAQSKLEPAGGQRRPLVTASNHEKKK